MTRWILAALIATASLLLAACGGGGGGGDGTPDQDPTGRFDSSRFDEHRWGE